MERPLSDTGPGRGPVFLYVVLVFGLWIAYVAAVYPLVQRAGPGLRILVNEGIRGVIFVLPAVLMLRRGGTQRPAATLGLRTHVGRGIRWGLLAGASLLAVHSIVRLALQGTLRLHPVPAEALFTSLSVATLIEEVAFRGYLLQQISRRTGFWWANGASAALFAAIHIPGWLLAGGGPVGTGLLVPLGEIFALGLALGFLFRWTGSLWSSVLLHVAHNLAFLLFYRAP